MFIFRLLFCYAVVPPKSSPAQTRIENGPETVELSTLEWRSPNDDVSPICNLNDFICKVTPFLIFRIFR